MRRHCNLPGKPSELIELGLSDLAKTEADPRYEIDMGVWHAPNYGGSEKCATCFAGAVMAQTCRLPIHISDTDQYFDEATWKKFLALDDFRCGAIGSALYHLGVEKPVDVPEDIQIEAPYRHNPDLFRQSMRDLANLLRSHGL